MNIIINFFKIVLLTLSLAATDSSISCCRQYSFSDHSILRVASVMMSPLCCALKTCVLMVAFSLHRHPTHSVSVEVGIPKRVLKIRLSLACMQHLN